MALLPLKIYGDVGVGGVGGVGEVDKVDPDDMMMMFCLWDGESASASGNRSGVPRSLYFLISEYNII